MRPVTQVVLLSLLLALVPLPLAIADAAPESSGVDLLVSGLFITGTRVTNVTFYAEATVSNVGTQDILGEFRAAFIVDGVEVFSYRFDGLPAGDSRQLRSALLFAEEGAHALTVVADLDQVIAEQDEENNAESLEFAVGPPGPNLSASIGFESPPSVFSGNRVTIIGTLESTGTERAVGNLTFEVLLDGQVIYWSTWPASLPPGRTDRIHYTIRAPEAGNHTLAFRLDVDDNITETVESDNDAQVPLRVLPAAQLSLTSLAVAPVQTMWGALDPLGRQHVDAQICNAGVPSVDAAVDFTLEPARDSTLRHGDRVYLGRLAIPFIGADACVDANVTFETYGFVGDFTISALVMARNEGNELDNFASATGTRFASGPASVTWTAGETPLRPLLVAIEGGPDTLLAYEPPGARELVVFAYANIVYDCQGRETYGTGTPVCDQLNGDLGYSTARLCRPGSLSASNPMNNLYTGGSIVFGALEQQTGENPCRGGAYYLNETADRFG